MSEFSTVLAALKGEVPVGSQVTVKGWLRSKRDSKAGISFLAVHDLSLIHISEPTRRACRSRMPSSA